MNILTNVQSMPKGSLNAEKISQAQKNVKVSEQPTVKTSDYKPDILDFLSEKIVNKNDIKDTVTVPRSLFKGYLCFTAGTAVNAIAGFIKNNKVSDILRVIGNLTAIYGTFNFVKPFLIREENLTKTEK